MKILVGVKEREISTRLLVEEENAQKELEQELCDAMLWDEDEIEDCLKEAYENRNYDFGIRENFAWANADDGDMNCDWLIFDFTKPYALVSVVDRNITIRQFDTLEKAQEKMKKEFQKCPDWKEWKKDFKPNEETYEYGFYDYGAWANADDDMEYDWAIIMKSWFS